VVLTQDKQYLLVRFEYNDALRLLIKGFPGAMWDRELRLWRLPVYLKEEIVNALTPHNFVISDALAEVRFEPNAASPWKQNNISTLSVSQINLKIAKALSSSLRGSQWVQGELSSFDRTLGRKHWFFELVERENNTEKITSRLSSVLFARQQAAVLQKLGESSDPIVLRDGLSVRVLGKIDHYSPTGRIQLIIEKIDPDYSLGQLARRSQEILETLKHEGLYGLNKNLIMPTLPLRVALLTAPESDAYYDVIKTLCASNYPFEVSYFSMPVQGKGLEKSFCHAITLLKEQSDAFDVVLIVRGGGARSDLSWFDNLPMARKMAKLPIKVIVGIGHERDQSVLDYIAHSEKTPTAAAERLIHCMNIQENQYYNLAKRIGQAAHLRIQTRKHQQLFTAKRLIVMGRQHFERSRMMLKERFAFALHRQSMARFHTERIRLSSMGGRLRPEPLERHFRSLYMNHEYFQKRLKSSVQTGLIHNKQRLNRLTEYTQALDPSRVIARGFALLRNENGHLVKSPDEAPLGSIIDIQMAKGRLTAKVKRHDNHDTPGNKTSVTKKEEGKL
jgi:exodeoxyribonuclease VII large subunit